MGGGLIMECFREVIVENAEISWVSPEIYSSKEKVLKVIENRAAMFAKYCGFEVKNLKYGSIKYSSMKESNLERGFDVFCKKKVKDCEERVSFLGYTVYELV